MEKQTERETEWGEEGVLVWATLQPEMTLSDVQGMRLNS